MGILVIMYLFCRLGYCCYACGSESSVFKELQSTETAGTNLRQCDCVCSQACVHVRERMLSAVPGTGGLGRYLFFVSLRCGGSP